jgi:glycosyltransferase involved in cell wall biosynthesis
MLDLSVTLITLNEEKNIRRCLHSIKDIAAEIIIVDSGSTDKTLDIAKEFGAHIHSIPWQGYGPQKNTALSFATKKWVLSIDADEEVSPELATRLSSLLSATPTPVGYKIPRPVIFMGKKIRYATGSSFDVRLFLRGKGSFTPVSVHESLVIEGAIAALHEPLYHYSFGSVEDILSKLNKYTSLVAQQRYQQGKRGSIFKAITHSLSMFLKVYILKRGFLDGAPGFILAVSFAQGAYYRYIKLYEKGRG